MTGLSVILITKNEAHNIADCLRSVEFADEIIVVDSRSQDGTIEIAEAAGARVAVFDDWAEETRDLLARGYPEDSPGLKSLGYPQVIDYIAGKITRAQAAHSIVTLSMSYAKRQNTWFGRYKNVLRFELTDPFDYDTELMSEKILGKTDN